MAPGAPGSPVGAFSASARRGTPPHPLPRPYGAFPSVTRQGPCERGLIGDGKNTPSVRKKKGGGGKKSPRRGRKRGPGGDGGPGRGPSRGPFPEGPKDHGREALRRRSPEGRGKSPREGGKSPPEGAGEGFFFYPGDPFGIPQDRDAWVGAGAWARFVRTAGRRSRPRNDPTGGSLGGRPREGPGGIVTSFPHLNFADVTVRVSR